MEETLRAKPFQIADFEWRDDAEEATTIFQPATIRYDRKTVEKLVADAAEISSLRIKRRGKSRACGRRSTRKAFKSRIRTRFKSI